MHEKLSVQKMYKLYQKLMTKKMMKPEMLHMYMQVFNDDFNLSFFKRKKDKCTLCNALDNFNVDPQVKRIIFKEQEMMTAM